MDDRRGFTEGDRGSKLFEIPTLYWSHFEGECFSSRAELLACRKTSSYGRDSPSILVSLRPHMPKSNSANTLLECIMREEIPGVRNRHNQISMRLFQQN